MSAKGYVIHTRFAEDIPEIMADGDMLYQAFLNLLINGMQAMPEGGAIHVAVETENQAVWVVIEDDGHGVPRQVMEKIWD